MCGCFDNLDFKDNSIADPFDLLQGVTARREDRVEVTKMVDQATGERFDVLPGDRAEQHEFQQFVFGDSLWPTVKKPRAQPQDDFGLCRFEPRIRTLLKGLRVAR